MSGCWVRPWLLPICSFLSFHTETSMWTQSSGNVHCYSGDERVSCALCVCVCVVGRGLTGRVWPCDGCVSHPVFSFSGRLQIARREQWVAFVPVRAVGAQASAGRKRGASWKSRGSKYDAPHTKGCDRETHRRAGKSFKFTSLFLPVLTLNYTTSSSERAAPAHTASHVCPFIHLFTWANKDLPLRVHSQVLISADNCFNSKALLILLLKGRDRRARPPGCCTKTRRKAQTLISDEVRDKSLTDQLPRQHILQTRPLTSRFGLSESPVLLLSLLVRHPRERWSFALTIACHIYVAMTDKFPWTSLSQRSSLTLV